MNFTDKAKRFFRRIEIPNIMTYIVATMAIIYVGDLASGFMISPFMSFVRSEILKGQVWRIVTFLGLPTNYSPFWFIISAMFYFGIGRDLEAAWGSHENTKYLLTGYLLTAAAGFISGHTSNTYLYLSLFLAYAALMPSNMFMIFFVIPVKAKWLALLDAVFMIFTLIFGSIADRLAVLAAFATFFIFFGQNVIRMISNKWKHRDFIHEMKRKNIKFRNKD